MEILVDEVYNEVKNQYEVCQYDNCTDDIKAIALNALPPAYFPSYVDEGERKSFLLNRQMKITALAKITEAAQIVAQRCKG
ncbi:MAG TPA: late competence development ComFB family protein [Tepidimicrobium sp.]|nr:late competence development ComFB family protein [Tepidimicrobium sp.]